MLVIISVLAWNIRIHPQLQKAASAVIADSITRYKLNTNTVRIRIKKSEYLLELFIDNKKVKSYPVVFGPDPVNDKTHEGDGCTPEGIYKIKAKYPHRSWSYFLWIDYPNEAAWMRFKANKKSGKITKQAFIGGDVGIHGVPFLTGDFGSNPSPTAPHADYMIDKKINWTLGCISLKTEDIKEIYKYVPVGTEVEIIH